MANYLGALIGAAVDRQDGDSGIKGAILGTIAESAIRVMVPIAITFAIGAAVQYGARRAVDALTGGDAPAA